MFKFMKKKIILDGILPGFMGHLMLEINMRLGLYFEV